MRLMLFQLYSYTSNKRGGPKANRTLLEGLAARGHECRAFLPASEQWPGLQSLEDVRLSGIEVSQPEAALARFHLRGVEVTTSADLERLHDAVQRVVALGRDFAPDLVLVSSDDFQGMLLEAALTIAPERVVILVHSVEELMPMFGPTTTAPDERLHDLYRRAAGIVTCSHFVRRFLLEHGGLAAEVLRPPMYGTGVAPELVDASGFITFINPCRIKGIDLFEPLARALPEVRFAVVPGAHTTDLDRERLQKLENLEWLRFADVVDDVYSKTRILLVPSLCDEAFGIVSVEAMLRGIPVLASDSGGLPEAKLGVDYVLPVSRIEWEQDPSSRRFVPRVPVQDTAPWEAALRGLLEDAAKFDALSKASRRAAMSFVSTVGVEPFERHFLGLAARLPGPT